MKLRQRFSPAASALIQHTETLVPGSAFKTIPEVQAGQRVLAVFSRCWTVCAVVGKVGNRYRLKTEKDGQEFSTVRSLIRVMHG